MGGGLDMTDPPGQAGLGALQDLALGFFTTAQDQGFFRRIQVQPRHVLEFFLEAGSFDNLKVRVKCSLSPLAAHRR